LNRSSGGLAQPLPLAGEVGAKRRVGAFSTLGVSFAAATTPTPALPRKRERGRTSVVATIKPHAIAL